MFGEAQPFNTAIVCPVDASLSPKAIAEAILNANRNLPDYARVADFVVADEPFAVANGLLPRKPGSCVQRCHRAAIHRRRGFLVGYQAGTARDHTA